MASNNIIKHAASDFRDAIIIAPHNSTNIVADATNNPMAYPTVNALMVAAAGNAVVVIPSATNPANEVLLTFTSLPVGTIIPVSAKRVNATGTTATLIGLIR